jgi:DNA topoisomerase-1
MRTDSTRVSEQALGEVRDHISGAFGDTYLPGKPNKFRTKKDAQDAHEAIRPTAVANDPESVKAHLTEDQFYLYRLIWSRFVASQMLPATFDDTTLDVSAVEYVLRAKGSVPKFNGWLSTNSRRRTANRRRPVPRPMPTARRGCFPPCRRVTRWSSRR